MWLTSCPKRCSSLESRLTLREVQRSGDCGSPETVGSMSPSRSTINVASASAIRLLPPPARRIESGGSGCSSLSSSRRPRRTVDAEIPVASATTPTPPLPIALASVAAHTRRDRSFSVGERASYFSCSESTSTQLMSATELRNGQLFIYGP